ncbi:MAG: alanine racemase [Acidobacteriota bacterium]|nr:alanine racemase [Acidobacteriota bacterium]
MMAAVRPGAALRPHVKAHKCSELGRHQRAVGHPGFTCATLREMEVMARAGLGDDLLLANEVVDARRLSPLVAAGHRISVAVDSEATVEAAASAGVPEVLVDVNVGLPRCGCDPADAAWIADLARRRGLVVRGVMGYEGHAVGIEDRVQRQLQVAAAMAVLAEASVEVGGEVISAGGTGSYDLNDVATEIQAGSYALMDTAYSKLGLGFGAALSVLSTVVSVNRNGWAVADCGLKALGMDHGNPGLRGPWAEGLVWFCSDEHVTFSPPDGRPLPEVGARIELLPAHVDPTVAYHEWLHVVDADHESVLESWPVDMRGW